MSPAMNVCRVRVSLPSQYASWKITSVAVVFLYPSPVRRPTIESWRRDITAGDSHDFDANEGDRVSRFHGVVTLTNTDDDSQLMYQFDYGDEGHQLPFGDYSFTVMPGMSVQPPPN